MKYRSIKTPPGAANVRLDDVVGVAHALSGPIQPAKGPGLKNRLSLSRKGHVSLKRQVTEQMGWLIETGSLAAGSYLPSELELANSLKVARNVVRGSYESLMRTGKIKSEGKGRTINGTKKSYSASASKRSVKSSSKRPAKLATSKRLAHSK